tara:strand:- start:1411 stop:1770 length:360 start_codon:yes stop_codon:yes gene_type:complete
VSKKDPNYVVKIEKAISEKYGEETIKSPKSDWSPDKEREYLQQLKEKEEKLRSIESNKKLLKNKSSVARKCDYCGESRIKRKHDVYFSKFGCCFECYVKWVEDREERWASGWRPEIKSK